MRRSTPLGWLVFVEVPLGEAFAPLYGAALRSAVLLALGLAGGDARSRCFWRAE